MAATTTFNADFLTFPGDTVVPLFTVVDADGDPVNISAATAISWIVRQDETSAALATLTLAAGDIALVGGGTQGQFQVTIGSAVTALLNGAYQHLARVTFGAAGTVTAIVGRMMSNQNVNWSYNAARLAEVPLYQVRRLLGDVIPDDPQIYDTEIQFFITARGGNVYYAAADAARAIAAQYSRKVDTTSPGPIKTAYGGQAKKYFELANELAQQAKLTGRFVTGFAGGISVQQKIVAQETVDRVRPNFTIGMTDNLIPIPSSGAETPTAPFPGSGP